MEITKEIEFDRPNRLEWLVSYHAGYRATVTLTYKDSTFPLFTYEFGNTVQRTPKVECGQTDIMRGHALLLTVTIKHSEHIDCLTRNDSMSVDRSGKQVAEWRRYMFETSQNPDYQDYGGLSVSLVNYPLLL
jgi:hypothetical protein